APRSGARRHGGRPAHDGGAGAAGGHGRAPCRRRDHARLPPGGGRHRVSGQGHRPRARRFGHAPARIARGLVLPPHPPAGARVVGRVLAIALNTFREAVRWKVLYAVLIMVVVVNFAAIGCGAWSQNEEARVAVDFGLGSVAFFGVITAIVLGVNLLYAEAHKPPIRLLLAKPLRRHEVVLGKYLGMVVTLTILVAAFGAAMVGQLALTQTQVTAALFKAVLLAWMEVLIVAALAILFSSFS